MQTPRFRLDSRSRFACFSFSSLVSPSEFLSLSFLTLPMMGTVRLTGLACCSPSSSCFLGLLRPNLTSLSCYSSACFFFSNLASYFWNFFLCVTSAMSSFHLLKSKGTSSGAGFLGIDSLLKAINKVLCMRPGLLKTGLPCPELPFIPVISTSILDNGFSLFFVCLFLFL